MKIREKIFLGVGTYIFLAAMIGFYAYRELYIITTRLPVVEKIHHFTYNVSEMRRREKNYLLYRQPEDIAELRKLITALRAESSNITPDIEGEIGAENFEKARKDLLEYDQLSGEVIRRLNARDAAEKLLSSRGNRIEQRLKGNELQSFLALRGFEKVLVLNRDSKSFDAFTGALKGLKFSNPEMKRYAAIAGKLYALYVAEEEAENKMHTKGQELQAFSEGLYSQEWARIPGTMRRSLQLLLFSVFVIIIVGAVVNTRLAMSIAGPIRKLETKTKKIAMGDFSEKIEVKGDDEVASLAKSFTQMEDHLKLALSSLEHTITQLQEKQAQLVEAEKLASIGILTAGIAHEINNPLTSVLSFSKLMLEQMPETDKNYARLKIMVRDAQRARTIVRELLSFAKENPIHPLKIDVNQPITEIIESLVAQDAFADIELNVNLAKGLPEISADPVRIGQVAMNMLLNAVHSINPPGKIEVETRQAGGMIEIVFTETGLGIPEEHLNNIFDPFFTTKGPRKGTGLGLAISYGIIKKHGGDIEVKSAVGQGSTFIVRLPVNG